ncbi:MAG: sigma-70 family RNA polymerase sigma factor [candidate division Zixibacteria bacterium]
MRVGEKEDRILVDKVLAGDTRAFGKLVEKYKKRIYYLAYRMTRDHDSADELAQESFVRAYQAMSGFKREYSFYTWIYRICVNLTINFLKRESQKISVDSFEGGYQLLGGSDRSDQLERMIASEQAAIIKRTLNTLPPDQKAVFVLKTYDDMSYQGMAKVMNCSIGTVMSRLFRARHKLRKALEIADVQEDREDERL